MSELAVIVPPAPPVHAEDLPLGKFVIQFLRNSISTQPSYAFDVLIRRNRMLGVDNLLVNDPAGIRHVLIEARERYRRPVASVRPVRPLSGAGVLLAEGETWRRQRRTLAPLFTPTAVSEMLPHFQAAATSLLRKLDERSPVNLSAAYHEATLDAVLRGLFSLAPEKDDYGIAYKVRSYVNGPGRPNLLDGLARNEGDFGFANAARRRFSRTWFAAVDRIVAARRAGAHARDLLGLLLDARDPENDTPLSDTEVRDQAATMLFAGFETTSRLLFWASYLLSLDQPEQARIRSEVRAFPPERVSSLQDTAQWPRLRQTLLEALRLYPPVVHIVRDAIEPDEVLGERVQQGDRIWISPWIIHRHRRFWDNPTAFVPSRFKDQRSPWTGGHFIPFGVGPRICIGAAFAMAEAEILLATVLSRFEISLTDARAVLPVANVTLRPSFEPRFNLTRA